MKWYEWTRHIRDHCDAPPDVKTFLMYLATYADAEGRCFPAYPRLAGVMGVAVSTVQRRRHRAVELGYLRLSGGRWRGDPTHYQLIQKGADDAHLPKPRKVPTNKQKGTDERPGKVPTVSTERISTFQEGDVSTPFLGTTHSSPTEKRRLLARQIREARNDAYRQRFMDTFLREYGRVYGQSVRSPHRVFHPAMRAIIREWGAAA